MNVSKTIVASETIKHNMSNKKNETFEQNTGNTIKSRTAKEFIIYFNTCLENLLV